MSDLYDYYEDEVDGEVRVIAAFSLQYTMKAHFFQDLDACSNWG